MNEIPLHPALVHIPIGVAFVLPCPAVVVAIAIGKGKLPKTAWLVVVGLQVIVLAGGIASVRTGEEDRRRTVMLVGSANLDPHEEAGDAFNVSAGVSLALGIASFFPGGTIANVGRAATVLASSACTYFAYSAGHSGGGLVYQFGAASAYLPKK